MKTRLFYINGFSNVSEFIDFISSKAGSCQTNGFQFSYGTEVIRQRFCNRFQFNQIIFWMNMACKNQHQMFIHPSVSPVNWVLTTNDDLPVFYHTKVNRCLCAVKRIKDSVGKGILIYDWRSYFEWILLLFGRLFKTRTKYWPFIAYGETFVQRFVNDFSRNLILQ